jgi:hypothetical protein
MGLLRASQASYGDYYEKWIELFNRDDTQKHLQDACGWLPDSRYAGSLAKSKVLSSSDVNSNWFKNRVFDMRLFFLGDPKQPLKVGKKELRDVLGPGVWP